MNKIIKFRALSKNGWVYSDKHGLYDFFYGVSDGQFGEASQFTGLLDISNKEIYDGDIVEITYTDSTPEGRLEFETVKRLVKWDSVELKWGLEYPDFKTFSERLSDFKTNVLVIGNIFENPELLNS